MDSIIEIRHLNAFTLADGGVMMNTSPSMSAIELTGEEAARLANWLIAHLPETATGEGARYEARELLDWGFDGKDLRHCRYAEWADYKAALYQATYWLDVYADRVDAAK